MHACVRACVRACVCVCVCMYVYVCIFLFYICIEIDFVDLRKIDIYVREVLKCICGYYYGRV